MIAATLASTTGRSPCFKTGFASEIVAIIESVSFTGATIGVITYVYIESNVGETATVSLQVWVEETNEDMTCLSPLRS